MKRYTITDMNTGETYTYNVWDAVEDFCFTNPRHRYRIKTECSVRSVDGAIHWHHLSDCEYRVALVVEHGR